MRVWIVHSTRSLKQRKVGKTDSSTNQRDLLKVWLVFLFLFLLLDILVVISLSSKSFDMMWSLEVIPSESRIYPSSQLSESPCTKRIWGFLPTESHNQSWDIRLRLSCMISSLTAVVSASVNISFVYVLLVLKDGVCIKARYSSLMDTESWSNIQADGLWKLILLIFEFAVVSDNYTWIKVLYHLSK